MNLQNVLSKITFSQNISSSITMRLTNQTYRKTSKETRGYYYLLQATNEGIIRKSLNETCQN